MSPAEIRKSLLHIYLAYGLRPEQYIGITSLVDDIIEYRLQPQVLLQMRGAEFGVSDGVAQTIGYLILQDVLSSTMPDLVGPLLLKTDPVLVPPIQNEMTLNREVDQIFLPDIEVVSPTITPQNPRLPLQRAMTEYPMLGQQSISADMVKLRSQIAPVRGTLYNWIKAYRDELGVRKHDTIERTNFLFTSENGKKLSTEEKDHMHHVIEALEDGVAVEVDVKRQSIVWPGVMQSQQVAEVRVPDVQKNSSVPLQSLQSQERMVDDTQLEITAAPYTVTSPAASASGPMGRVSFSTNHVLPSETPEYTGSELVDTWLAENQTPAADPAPATPPTARNMRM